MNQVIIAAPGLADLVGHEYEYTAAVARAFRRRGYSVSVLGARNAAPEVVALEGFVPTFRPTARPPGTRALPWEFLRLAWTFLTDLSRALPSLDVDRNALLFAPTITYPGFIGWAWCICRLGKRLPKTVLLLRFSLALQNPSRFTRLRRLLLPLIYRVLFWLVRRPACPLFIAVDSEELRDEYRRYTRLPIRVVPIPLEVESFEKALSEASGKPRSCNSRRLLYLGDVRRGKGFDLLPPLVEALTASDAAGTSVTIHCGRPADRHAEPGIAEAYLRLRELSEAGAVELIPSNLSRGDYLALLGGADVVLLPYRREYYMGQTSNVLAEAFAAGKPVVAPKHTWMATRVASTGAGTTFESGDADSLLEATREVLRNLPRYADAASRLRESWIGFHNAERLVDELERP